ncbi:hypothetical protein K439DRAFT_1033147 [Ramaria rubella]|nr:hypothetical protein K439DRAFT_1033147 [Ramaria rubella]
MRWCAKNVTPSLMNPVPSLVWPPNATLIYNHTVDACGGYEYENSLGSHVLGALAIDVIFYIATFFPSTGNVFSIHKSFVIDFKELHIRNPNFTRDPISAKLCLSTRLLVRRSLAAGPSKVSI